MIKRSATESRRGFLRRMGIVALIFPGLGLMDPQVFRPEPKTMEIMIMPAGKVLACKNIHMTDETIKSITQFRLDCSYICFPADKRIRDIIIAARC